MSKCTYDMVQTSLHNIRHDFQDQFLNFLNILSIVKSLNHDTIVIFLILRGAVYVAYFVNTALCYCGLQFFQNISHALSFIIVFLQLYSFLQSLVGRRAITIGTSAKGGGVRNRILSFSRVQPRPSRARSRDITTYKRAHRLTLRRRAGRSTIIVTTVTVETMIFFIFLVLLYG